MRMYLCFLQLSPSGQEVDALGSDGTWFDVQNKPLHRLRSQALAHARSLQRLGKHYIGYHFLTGRTLTSAHESSLKSVYFTENELHNAAEVLK